MTAMLKIFAPRARTPPSAKRKHCTTNTAVMTMMAALGPNRTEISTAPSRCPDVPPATGKFNICAAKTKAAARPSRGICCCGNCFFVCRQAAPTPITVNAAVAMMTLASRKPSGMCMTAIVLKNSPIVKY